MKFLSFSAGLVLAFVLNATSSIAQDHGHLNIGAQGSALIFDNGADFTDETDYVNTLTLTNSGRFSGYHVGSITLTALAATANFGGPQPNAAALGTRIAAQIENVEGPAGGAIGFWETGAASPTIEVPVGALVTNLWIISENDGSPETDPYGHIHGRRFTATKAGVYKVTFRAWDVSTNGINGQPIYGPSLPLSIWFQAGINIRSLTKSNNEARLVFGAKAGSDWQVEYAEGLEPVNWNTLGDPISGTDYFVEVTDSSANSELRLYRVRTISP